MSQMSLHPIGVVRTQYTAREHTPVQSALNPDATGTAVLDERYTDALRELTGFDHVWLLTWLGREGDASEPALRQVPYLLQNARREIGIFATRGPRRPNPIGLSMVRLLAVEANVVRFSGVDLVDGTPLLDIKPWVAAFDRPSGNPRSGWFDEVDMPSGATPTSLRRDG